MIINIIWLATVIAGLYWVHPAVNIKSPGLWFFIAFSFVGKAVVKYLYAVLVLMVSNSSSMDFVFNEKNITRDFAIAGSIIGIAAIIGLTSSVLINAKDYSNLITVTEGNFESDIKEINYNEIPLLDKDSAALLGNRKMGTMVDMVSQFEVSDEYNQINLNNKPKRVTPLKYANIIKWFNNNKEGIPAYITIDMSTQETECVRLEEGKYIKYSKDDKFNRNIWRHVQFKYPTYMFNNITFEINDDGNPVWVCSALKKTIGLFGGRLVDKVVICDAITGDTQCYNIEDCPEWVDTVYSSDMMIELYDYYGTYKDGFINSILGQKGCLETTDGYNYLALNDDIWLYTGVTSLSGDESNVGFILMNKRTLETKYYTCPGAEEYSAMDSAEGQVQHLGYTSTFPLLLNVAGEPTYFIALKDAAGLVKMYAMVNIEEYQLVATGNTVIECEKNYLKLLKNNSNISISSDELTEISGEISKISPISVDGNTYYYITLKDSDEIYSVLVSETPHVVLNNIGDKVKIGFNDSDTEVNDIITIETLEKDIK
ncbi:MAG: CvpA family protein [Lachnospiraceae bacterium]|nr:CvpA family protein [Lachnospiraceae bacterium]